MVMTQNVISLDDNPIKKRIEYAELYYTNEEGKDIVLKISDLKDLLDYMIANTSIFVEDDRFNNKWYNIEAIQGHRNYCTFILRNCMYMYRPKLINVITMAEKESPKTPEEGEKQRTHFMIKENYLLFEKRRNGTPLSTFVKFLNLGVKDILGELNLPYEFIKYRMLMIDDFVEVFDKSNRIKNITITKSFVNSNDDGYYNFHDENTNIEYKEFFSARRNKTLNKGKIKKYIFPLISDDSRIEKITMEIDDENNNAVTINTERMVKHHIIKVSKDEYGIAETESIIKEMLDL